MLCSTYMCLLHTYLFFGIWITLYEFDLQYKIHSGISRFTNTLPYVKCPCSKNSYTIMNALCAASSGCYPGEMNILPLDCRLQPLSQQWTRHGTHARRARRSADKSDIRPVVCHMQCMLPCVHTPVTDSQWQRPYTPCRRCSRMLMRSRHLTNFELQTSQPTLNTHLEAYGLPSVLLMLLVGQQERHPACKHWVEGWWRGYLSGATCRIAYGPADATATHCLLLQ